MGHHAWERFVPVLILFILSATVPLGAYTINVPADQPTIQAGIDDAVDGDTVLVSSGYYTGPGNREIDFQGKAITVTSADGAASCLIDCLGHKQAFVFQNGEGPGSVLQGFTIINGRGYRGGAILCLSASPIIRDNVFRDCVAENGGGAISCEEGFTTPLITNNLFTGNDGGDQGGAIYFYECNALITRNTFNGNRADYNGAIDCNDSRFPVISHNLIINNTGERGGGAIGSGYFSDPLVINNLIMGNAVTSDDGAFGGGAVLVTRSEIRLVNNTIVGNHTPRNGGAIYAWDSSPLIVNSIIRDNTSPTGEEIHLAHYSGYQPTLTIRHSNLEGGSEAVFIESGCHLDWGPGMIDADPLFVSGPLGDHYLSQVTAGQAVDSPCVDTGDPNSERVAGVTRTDGVQDGLVVDMGYHAPVTDAPTRLVTAPGPSPDNPPLIRVFLPAHDAEHETEFHPYSTRRFSASIATGDLDGDGSDEIVTGTGPSRFFGPMVRGFELDGRPLPGLSAFAYGAIGWGVKVAAGDIDHDGFDEIITGPGPGPMFGPHVRAFDYDGSGQLSPVAGVNFLAYSTIGWGVGVAAGDIDGDGYEEILTGPGPGDLYGPYVRGWDVSSGVATAMADVGFLAYGTNRWGAVISCGDVDGDGMAEIVTAPGPSRWFGAHIRGWNYDGTAIAPLADCSFFAWAPDAARFGASVHAGTDLDGDGRDDIVVGIGPDPDVWKPTRVFTYDGSIRGWFSFQAYPEEWTHGARVAAGRI